MTPLLTLAMTLLPLSSIQITNAAFAEELVDTNLNVTSSSPSPDPTSLTDADLAIDKALINPPDPDPVIPDPVTTLPDPGPSVDPVLIGTQGSFSVSSGSLGNGLLAGTFNGIYSESFTTTSMDTASDGTITGTFEVPAGNSPTGQFIMGSFTLFPDTLMGTYNLSPNASSSASDSATYPPVDNTFSDVSDPDTTDTVSDEHVTDLINKSGIPDFLPDVSGLPPIDNLPSPLDNRGDVTTLTPFTDPILNGENITAADPLMDSGNIDAFTDSTVDYILMGGGQHPDNSQLLPPTQGQPNNPADDQIQNSQNGSTGSGSGGSMHSETGGGPSKRSPKDPNDGNGDGSGGPGGSKSEDKEKKSFFDEYCTKEKPCKTGVAVSEGRVLVTSIKGEEQFLTVGESVTY